MPSQTFFNLPEEKRQKLLDAIEGEFARAPYEEVSINQIVRAAGIPRGSFYQYFENKQDMVDYLLSGYRRKALQRARQSLAASGGDLFQMFLDLLDYTYAFSTCQGGSAFTRSILADTRHNTNFLFSPRSQNAAELLSQELLPQVDTQCLDIRGPDDLADMLGVLVPLTGDAFAQTFYDVERYNQVRARYAARLELLKRGFARQAPGKNADLRCRREKIPAHEGG